MDAVPPGPEVKKGDPADSNFKLGHKLTNVAMSAINGDHMQPTACGWLRGCVHRPG